MDLSSVDVVAAGVLLGERGDLGNEGFDGFVGVGRGCGADGADAYADGLMELGWLLLGRRLEDRLLVLLRRVLLVRLRLVMRVVENLLILLLRRLKMLLRLRSYDQIILIS